MAAHANKYPHQLLGRQQQRVRLRSRWRWCTTVISHFGRRLLDDAIAFYDAVRSLSSALLLFPL
ncbi:hypothetical protein C9I57_14555 [Trinickia symbiotica]|uniref:Uncharacterized protein n=1 Tax=Trinickia symbiotica TaxID=863227 RepID=A0A2T3XUU2_9BURK|nr:hypothetical protein C9I57_14555 [Trinickia symbiotica]